MVMTVDEAYQVLGVSRGASESVVKTAYKKLALKTHPDKNPDDPDARAKFQRISEAYKRITDPEAFQDEDELDFEDLNNMFASMFADMMPMMFSMGGPNGPFNPSRMSHIPFEMFEMMMTDMMMEEMGMHNVGPGGMYEDYGDEGFDSDDENMDDVRLMEAMLGAGRSGADILSDMSAMDRVAFMNDDDDEEDDIDDYYPQMRSQGMGIEEAIMREMMHGGGGMSKGDVAAMEDLLSQLDLGEGGPRYHSHMYGGGRAPARDATDDDWVTDSSDEGIPPTKPNISKKKTNIKKSNSKKKKKKTKKVTKPGSSVGAQQLAQDIASAEHVDWGDQNDITADEMANLMNAILIGEKPEDRTHDHRKTATSNHAFKKGGTINHSPTGMGGKGVTNDGRKQSAGSGSEEECFFSVGDKVMVNNSHSGSVAYVGAVDYAQGEFVGVVMDEEIGKNNGTVKGRRYFSCPPRRGLMVRATDIRPLSFGDLSK
mmetsp:Transcript_24818/g.36601  ORF Transcript_24818/g.36601 Transcript_24818/m.36601 type:complete len:484 (-) Transcript_24818:65-1516(-)|eukprot:CAMPEP_0185030476 /NCGR_PEP_ID=MMETSP1103-20130426/17479_1 /TAXON_ID=36769 /ORGANISM="Paraphysomonas bandaiensis, Strain Caron Lab Isolate" /LENGTH=483 /DNA_ID=CAMNT_0027565635 /DNA_START=24 /DNA_END=1475 /DNA_ORIENTATION=+